MSRPAGKPYSSVREKACDCLIGILFMTVLALVICITPAITRLLILIQPKLPDFNIPSSSLSIFRRLDNDTVLADWNVNMIIDNLDRKGFYYHHIGASVLLQATNLPVSNITIKPLEQKGRVQESIEAVFSNMTIEFVNNSSVMRMEVRAMAEYRGWTWPVKRDSIKVVCKEVKVELMNISRSGVEFGRSSCDVSGRWKKLVAEWTSLFWDYLYVLVIFLGILVLSF